MTERQAMETFETRFAGHVRAYTDVATARRIDALAVARTAMSSRRAGGWSERRLGAGPLGRRRADICWTVALVAILLVGLVGVGVLGRPAVTPTPIPDVLRHSWQRAAPVAPGPDLGGPGFLDFASGQLEYGRRDRAGLPSGSGIVATGPETLVVTATVETVGCTLGDVGTYRWSMEGKGSVLTLTAAGPDACAAREGALTGQWVRNDFPPRGAVEATLAPGTYLTSGFDPFGDPSAPVRLSYTVPEGWKVKEDQPATFVLHHLPDVSTNLPATESMTFLFAEPRLATEFTDDAICGHLSEAPGVGRGVDAMVAAIRARPGVISTPPETVTIGGYQGQMLDLDIAPSWSGGCWAPEGLIVSIPILMEAGSEMGPAAGIGPDHPFRLILLQLSDERTMSIVMACVDPSRTSPFADRIADAMPIVESFEFRAPRP